MSLGRYLLQERELRGVTLEEVSAVTKIPRGTLRAIEEDDVDRLPGRVYMVAYLRAYSSAVGLDSDEVLLRYQEITGESPAMLPADPVVTRGPSVATRAGWLVLGVALLAALGALFFVGR